MAKRELSSTLRNLKFMQRAARKEEKTREEDEVKPDGNFVFPGTVKRKCVVIMEGDPHPGAVLGRMSFQSFNPSIDKLNEAANKSHQPEASTISSSNQSRRNSLRENGSSQDGAECSSVDKLHGEGNGDLKRKQIQLESKPPSSNKSPKTVQAGAESSPSNNKGSFKQPKRGKLDWSVLRPPKLPNREGDYS